MAADEPFDYFEFAKEVTFAHARALLHGGPTGCLPLNPQDGEPRDLNERSVPPSADASPADGAVTPLSSRPVLYAVKDNT